MSEQDALLEDLAGVESDLFAMMAELRDCPSEYRHTDLVAWCRSPLWHPAMMIMTGWQGKLAREAFSALQTELEADTPGRRWYNLPYDAGRASIWRLLALPEDGSGAYAAAPFKTWIDDDDRPWIAGAVGVMPGFATDKITYWRHIDIRDVILWDPRTNESRIVGEHASVSAFVVTDVPDDRVTIWADTGAYFRAWAARRLRVSRKAQARARGEWNHPVTEATDSDLPGALLVGDPRVARWPHDFHPHAVVPGAGLTAAELHWVMVRSTNLPQIQGA